MEKNILITGCSSGIGLCAAETLKKLGYRVFATARKLTDVDYLKKMGFESFLLDLNDSDTIQTTVAQILEKTQGKIDALFNNSGYGAPGAVEDLTREVIRKQFETNVFGTMELTNLILPVMRKQGYGRIIQNCSILGIIAMPYRGAYSASKFALEAFSNTLRLELRGTGIYVSILEPGPIITKFRKNAFKNFKENIANKPSHYEYVYKNMENEIINPAKENLPFALGPQAVVNKLIRALESKHPKAHYYIGFPSHLFAILRRVLPDFALDWAIANACKEEMQWQTKSK